MDDIVERLRTFVKTWLFIKSNCETIHAVNGFEITTDDLTEAASEIEALRAENERLREQVAANRDTFETLDIIDDPIGAAAQCEAASKNCIAALKEPKL